MITAEIPISRRDFLTFLSKHKREKQSRPHRHESSRPQSYPPSRNRFTRPQFLAGAAAVATAVATGSWGWFVTQEDKPESLESLVAQAKRTEDEFGGKDLFDGEIRNQYTKLLADIFIKYYSLDKLGVSKPQLLSSVVWVNSKRVFEEIFIEQNQDPAFSREYLKQVANQTPAFTTKDNKTYINTAYAIYQENLTSQDPKFPKNWNPLKSLRLTLFHEFSHAICLPAEDTVIFSIVDSKNALTGRIIEGFRIQGFTGKKEFVGLYDSIDEACVELLSKYINTDLFHSFVSEYGSTQDHGVTAIMTNLEQLVNSAKIDKIELAHLHKTSNLRGFLLLITERYGIDPRKVTEKDRIIFGFSILEALIRNNQAILQDYMNSARHFTK